MKRIIIITQLVVMVYPIAAQNTDKSYLEAYPKIVGGYLFTDLDFVHCTVGFTISHMGWSKVTGSFSNFSGAVLYHENKPQSLTSTFSIDVNSINTNQQWRDKDLKTEKWFDSPKYPQIVFQSSRVYPAAEGFVLFGNLTMKGVTREVKLKMEPPSGYFKSYLGHQLVFNGTTRINRKNFGIGENTWWNDVIEGIAQLDDSVDIQLSIIYQLQSPEFIKSRFFDNETAIYQKVINNGPDAGIREFEKQKKAYEELEIKDEDDFTAITAKDLNTVGKALVLEGKDSLAKALFEYNVKTYPDTDLSILPLALLYLKQQNHEKAGELAQTCVKLNPYNSVALEILRHSRK